MFSDVALLRTLALSFLAFLFCLDLNDFHVGHWVMKGCSSLNANHREARVVHGHWPDTELDALLLLHVVGYLSISFQDYEMHYITWVQREKDHYQPAIENGM